MIKKMENKYKNINEIQYLIENNNLNELINYVNDNNIEFKIFCNKYFNIVSYTCSIYEKKVISSKIKDFVIFHYDKNISMIVNIMNENNLNELQKFIIENNIKLKDLNYKYFNILKYSKYLYSKDIISDEIYNYILNNYNKHRKEVIELIKTNDTIKLYDYLKNNHIEFKQLNDDDFDVIEYSNNANNNVSFKMKSFIIHHFDKKREKIIELMKKNDIAEIKKFLIKNNIELRDLDDNHFSIIDYVKSSSDFIFPNTMQWFILSHYNQKRYEIIELIRNDCISDLKRYIDIHDIEFESLNDKYFNLIQYINFCENCISSTMKYFVLSHYNRKRYRIVELIRYDNVKKLKKYIEDNNIYLEEIYDDDFNLLKYVRLNTNHISLNMKIFVLTHLNKKRHIIVEIINKNNYQELKEYIEMNNIELKSYNDTYFDIIRYSFSLYDQEIISFKVRDYIILAYDKRRREIIEIIKKNDINELKKYVFENNIILDNLNGNHFNIVKYTSSYLYDVKPEIINFIKANHNKNGTQIFKNLIKENKYNNLKNFVEINNFYLKSLNNYDFDILNYSMNLFNSGIISSQIKDFIFNHYDQKRNEIIELIHKNNIDILKEYSKINNIVFKNFDDKYFNIKDLSIELYNKNVISLNVKLFILAHYNKTRKDIIYIIQNNDIEKLKRYIKENNIEIKDLNDEYFDIIKYSMIFIKNVSVIIIDYLLSHFNKERATIIDLIKMNDISKLKQYFCSHNININNINDKNFNILKYISSLYNKKQISIEIRDFIVKYI